MVDGAWESCRVPSKSWRGERRGTDPAYDIMGNMKGEPGEGLFDVRGGPCALPGAQARW
jgi:hypothetical protein